MAAMKMHKFWMSTPHAAPFHSLDLPKSCAAARQEQGSQKGAAVGRPASGRMDLDQDPKGPTERAE